MHLRVVFGIVQLCCWSLGTREVATLWGGDSRRTVLEGICVLPGMVVRESMGFDHMCWVVFFEGLSGRPLASCTCLAGSWIWRTPILDPLFIIT